MKEKTIKLLAGWGDGEVVHEVGTVLKVDVELADQLIEKGVAKAHDPVADGIAAAKAKADNDAQLDAIAAKAVDGVIAKLQDGDLGKKITGVKDNTDADPLAGYGPEGHSLSLEDCKSQPGIVHWAFGERCKDIINAAQGGGAPERLTKSQAMSRAMLTKAAGTGMIVGDDEHGGYLIGPAEAQLMNMGVFERAIVRPLATRFTLGTQQLRIPYAKDENHTGNTVYGGIQIYFDEELAQLSESRPELAQKTFTLKKMTALGFVSDEMNKWSPVSIGSWLMERFMEAIAWKEDQVFINGKGGGQPLGMLNSNALISITKEGGQAADTIVLANTTKMYSRIRPKNESSVRWIMNRSCFPQLPQLNVSVGTGGAPVFINQTIQGAPGQSLWGYPIMYSEFAATVGDAKDVNLVDISDYAIADDQSGPAVAQSIHLKFDYAQDAMRVLKYIDGQNLQQVAFTPHKAGSTAAETLSTVVSLGART